jgi:hypothetical protein
VGPIVTIDPKAAASLGLRRRDGNLDWGLKMYVLVARNTGAVAQRVIGMDPVEVIVEEEVL